MSDETFDPDAPSAAAWLPVRASLRDVDVPTEARETAIAAALAAFDELHAQVPVAAAAATAAAATELPAVADDRPSNVVSLQTRMGSRWTRWIGSAAAAVAVLAVGGVIINGFGGSSNDQVSIEPTAALEAATSTDSGKLSQMAETNTSGKAVTATAQTGVEAAPSTIGSIGSGAVADTTVPGVVTAMAPTEDVADADGLAEYATRTAAAPPMANLPDSSCEPDGADTIGVITYQGITAIVVRNPDSSYSAIAVDTCTVLVTVTL